MGSRRDGPAVLSEAQCVFGATAFHVICLVHRPPCQCEVALLQPHQIWIRLCGALPRAVLAVTTRLHCLFCRSPYRHETNRQTCSRRTVFPTCPCLLAAWVTQGPGQQVQGDQPYVNWPTNVWILSGHSSNCTQYDSLPLPFLSFSSQHFIHPTFFYNLGFRWLWPWGIV